MPVTSTLTPAYRALSRAEWRARVAQAQAELACCRACPRVCGVDRLGDKWSACKTGRYAVVRSYGPHLGEEDCLRGWRGSGTIFFAHCNLRCVFCQNWDISQAVRPQPGAGLTPRALAAAMLELQDLGCHNINLVTPEHVVPQVVEALAVAVEEGLRLPVVYNTSAYDSAAGLALVDGMVDIYMPDFKLWSPERCRHYLMAEDYAEHARAAIREMQRQVGPLVLNDDGLARRGVLLRHLVMPGMLDETRAILEWVAAALGRDTFVNLMDQYRPAHRVAAGRFAELGRGVTAAEYREAVAIARGVGLTRLDQRRPLARWAPLPP